MSTRAPLDSVKILGLMGGVASGKSTVASLFQKLGAVILDADRLAHGALSEPEVLAAIVARWGKKVLDPRGGVDRKKMAEIVFEDPAQREYLNALIHPRVRQRMVDQIESLKAEISRGTRQAPLLIVLDVPLLLESPLGALCDVLVFVDASEESRRRRAVEHRGWEASEIQRREKFQKSLNDKRQKADYVVDNNQSIEFTNEQVQRLYHRILHETNENI